MQYDFFYRYTKSNKSSIASQKNAVEQGVSIHKKLYLIIIFLNNQDGSVANIFFTAIS